MRSVFRLPVAAASIAVVGLLASASGLLAQKAATAPPPGSRPDYARVFSTDRLHEIRITIPAARFRAMQEDLTSIGPAFGPRGGGPAGAGRPGGPPPFGDPQQMAEMLAAAGRACEGKAEGTACSASGVDGVCTPAFGGPVACLPRPIADMMRGGGPVNLTTRDPIYVPVTVQFEGQTWMSVGMRYKGNSSLMLGVGEQNGKVPFRLDFDRYAKEVPAIAGQRFHGFEKLTFSSNSGDDTQIHEVLAGELFRDRGVPAPRAAFYRVYVDVGAGAEYWGLYTMVEDPADPALLDSQLGGHRANLYKPEGAGADWTRFTQAGFAKKTNEKAADWSDVERAIAALHAPRTNPAAWRTTLEATFDVDLFLRWLAVNTTLRNWDSYGAMAHNYYLYGDPAHGGRLRWIPWDNNEAFSSGPGGGRRGGGPGGFGPPPGFGPPGGAGAGRPGGRGGFPGFGDPNDVLHEKAGDNWPLLSVLLKDEVYAARYRTHLQAALGGLFAPEAFATRARRLHALVAPAIVGTAGERPTHSTVSSADAFKGSLDGPSGLIAFAEQQRALVRAALAGAPVR